MIGAVIYDLDGVLIDSEPLWRRAHSGVYQEFGMPVTEDMCREATGLRLDEAIEFWAHRFPVAEEKFPQIEHEIIERVISYIDEEGTIMPGVRESIEFFQRKDLPLAVASSSVQRVIEAIVTHLELEDVFATLYSAEHEAFGKPHPAVYITTAQKLGYKPKNCLAIEDSVMGTLAAKAAKMRCISIPDNAHRADKRFGIADVVLSSLSEVDISVWDEVNT